MPAEIVPLTQNDVALLQSLNAMFAVAFDDAESYATRPPPVDYLQRLLANPTFIALVAVDQGVVVGGLAAYEFQKFEQQRSEIYLYDLAVLATHRRRGIASALIERLKTVGQQRGAYVVLVQCDKGPEDQPAIALYSKLGASEEVLHFDFTIDSP